MKKVISNTQLLEEIIRTRKSISRLELLTKTIVGNQHKIMRLIDPPRKVDVQDGDKSFEEIWNLKDVNKTFCNDDSNIHPIFMGIFKSMK